MGILINEMTSEKDWIQYAIPKSVAQYKLQLLKDQQIKSIINHWFFYSGN